MKFKKLIALICLFVFVVRLSAQPAKPAENPSSTKHTAGADDVRNLVSVEAGANYKVTINLPKSYFADQNRKFPVLILTDPDPVMGVAKTALTLMTGQKQLQEVILVGVGSDNRFRDMAPSPMQRFEGSGGADKFIAFLEKELFPFLEHYYQTDPSDRCFIGHSLAGLLGTHIFLEKPQLFKNYIIGSPSYWWNEKEMTKRLATREKVLEGGDVMLYTYVGGSEGMMVDGWNEFNSLLKSKIGSNVKYKEHIFPDETHATVVSTAFASAVKFVYGLKK